MDGAPGTLLAVSRAWLSLTASQDRAWGQSQRSCWSCEETGRAALWGSGYSSSTGVGWGPLWHREVGEQQGWCVDREGVSRRGQAAEGLNAGQSVLWPRGGAQGLSLIRALGELLPWTPAQQSQGPALFWTLPGGGPLLAPFAPSSHRMPPGQPQRPGCRPSTSAGNIKSLKHRSQ